ncbi:MAG: cytidylate kinase [Planctomycetota bacterium]|nr:MAG: cytidylate kinase [Planctomycetota bacterium]
MTKPHCHYNSDGIIVAIDGPAGAGKSTIAKGLALVLNYLYVDSGAMYRAVALYFLDNNIDIENNAEVRLALKNISISFHDDQNNRIVFLNGVDVTELIRKPRIYTILSKISALKEVRDSLVVLQRGFSKNFSLVMEGRDIGTIVFPEANYKFFLIADPSVRARRRYLELKHNGEMNIDEAKILEEIKMRDQKDSTREIAPLKKAIDAIEIDSSKINAEDVMKKMLTHLNPEKQFQGQP